MPEQVTYAPHAKLMRVQAWGDDPIEDWISSREQVMQLHEIYGAYQLLVDVRELETAPSILDIFDFAEDWPRVIRAAILVGEKTHKDVLFVESIPVNRHQQMRIFYDEDEALLWLGEKQDEAPRRPSAPTDL